LGLYGKGLRHLLDGTGGLPGYCPEGNVCGSGIGACIACNKIPGIRAALIHDTYCAHQCVEPDNVNVACVGAWVIGVKTAEEVLKAYLNATFGTDEDLRRRVQKLDQMDRKK
jgi:ribose 5-phosphate isomerase B